METRIADYRRQTVLCQQERLIQVYRGIECLTCRIVIYDFKVIVNRANSQIIFPWKISYDFVDAICLDAAAQTGIKGEVAQSPIRRRWSFSLIRWYHFSSPPNLW
jgi:hypothetical protein